MHADRRLRVPLVFGTGTDTNPSVEIVQQQLTKSNKKYRVFSILTVIWYFIAMYKEFEEKKIRWKY